MNGSGCKTCPVTPCHTLHYRGSYCAEQRAKLGLGDPQTNADRIRVMTDQELAQLIENATSIDGSDFYCQNKQECYRMLDAAEIPDEWCVNCVLEWLRKPAKEEP